MLKSENITLRAIEPSDVDFLFDIENDASLWKVSGTTIPFSRKTLLDYANSFHDLVVQKQFRFVICNNGNTVGLIDLFDYDPINRRCGIGIIVDKDSQNKQIAFNAIRILIDHSKNNLNLKQVHCSIHASNAKSIDLFTKLNFNQVGRRIDWYLHDNTWEDEILFQLIL
jgi:diamine N-acetyltransferase